MFIKQPIMRKVMLSLIPIGVLGIWLYGIRVLAVIAVSVLVSVAIEVLFEKKQGRKPSEAVFVTALLFALSMPPLVPLWIVAVGSAFAVFMAKAVFGGFGRNVFNPAISGRVFVYISFASVLGNAFIPGGNFGAALPAAGSGVDALSAATPLAIMRSGKALPFISLVSGIRNYVPGVGLQGSIAGGSIGESSIILIALAGVYLIATKTAQWRLMVSTLVGAFVLQGIFVLLNVPGTLPFQSLFAGSLWFVAVFMSTDPVSAPKKPLAQYVYGLIIGICIVLIRNFSAFPEGTSFAVLIGNTCASLLDKLFAVKQQTVRPVMP